MAEEPETSFARTPDGRQVAYQVVGSGPIDVLVTRPTAFGVDMMWEEPRLAHFLNALSGFSRHIWFDPRGVGSSDWLPHHEGRLVESTVEDMVAVLDAVGCRQVVVLGLAVPHGLLFAATHPERTSALALVNVSPRFRHAEGYEEGIADEIVDQALEGASIPGTAGYLELTAPSLAQDERAQRWFARAGRLALSPGDAPWRFRSFYDIDLRGVLDAIRVPTLVVNRRDGVIAAQVRSLAERIAGAEYVELPGADTLPFAGETRPVLHESSASSPARTPCPSPTACSRPCCSPIWSARPSRWRRWATAGGAICSRRTTHSSAPSSTGSAGTR
jgi:pimeloyl-ACP methyl ester carboxylesterase